MVEDRFADAGELLPPGSPLARVVSLSRVKAVINVPERYAGTISHRQPRVGDRHRLPGREVRGRGQLRRGGGQPG